MKLPFNKFIFFVLSVAFFSYTIVAKETSSEYIIEVGKIDIGKLFWSITINENKYNIFIKLEDRGFFSSLYSFSGTYGAKGVVVNESFIPLHYQQKWLTKKKSRNVDLYFTNGKVSKLTLLPKEVLPPKIEFLGVDGFVDPLSSFLNILISGNSSKTLDGRRFYKMVVAQEDLQNGILVTNINIEDYLNVWANHNKNDLGSIQFEQFETSKRFILPYKINIKYKGLVFKLNKI